MKILIITIYILSMVSFASAQSRFSGRAVNATDSSRAVKVSITISRSGGLDRIIESDSDGQFSFSIPPGKVKVLVSAEGFIPYGRDMVLPVSAPLLFKMIPSSIELQEFSFNTGYQLVDKTRSTGSFSKIDNVVLNQQVGKNLLDRLEAVGSGLSVDKSTSSTGRFMIRGLSTIRGPREPLIILDEMPYAGDFSNINPDDVENITILKDAAAASIWGTRAGNGVIVITTKKAKMNSPLQVSFDANVAIQQRPDLKYDKRISSSDFIDLESFLFSKGYYTSQLNSNQKPALTPFAELLVLNAAGGISTEELESERVRLAGYDVYNDFEKYIYENGFRQQYSLSLSAGTQKHSYILSSSYTRGYSNLGAADERTTARLASNYNLLKNLQLSSAFTYTGGKNLAGRPGLGGILSRTGIYPYARFADEQGNPLAITKNYRQTFLNSPATAALLDWSYYPLLDYMQVENKAKLTDLLANFDLNYKFAFGLKASLKYSVESQRSESSVLQGADSYFSRNLVNSFTQISPAGVVSYPVPRGGIYDSGNVDLNSWQFRPQLSYDRSWKEHRLSVIAGMEWRRAVSSGLAGRLYGYDSDKLSFGAADYTRTYPNFISGDMSFISSGSSVSKTNASFFSEFFNLGYTFRDTYTLSFSARADASNAFGVETNDKFKPLWSAGLAWELTKMPFLKSKVVDFLKLRVTYGLSGNTDPSMTAVTTIRYSGNSQYTLTPFALVDKFSNPSLRWETVRMLNAGLDFNLFSSRLNGSVEVYRKNAVDLFGAFPIDYTTGVGFTVTRNVAAISGNGFDLQLNSRNLNGAFQWQTMLNFSSARDKVKTYYLGSVQGSNFVQSGAAVSGIEGLPVYSIFSYRFAGLDPLTGDPRGYLGGVVSKDYNNLTGASTTINDLFYHGSALPGYFGNVINTFSYGGISLSVALSFKFDYYFRRKGIEYANLFTNWTASADYAARWRKTGDEAFTNIPSLIYPVSNARENFYRFSSELVEKGDHLRLQYVNIDYRFPAGLVKYLKLKSLSVFVNASNLGIIYRANKLGLDPDLNNTANPLPPGKTFSFGLRTQL